MERPIVESSFRVIGVPDGSGKRIRAAPHSQILFDKIADIMSAHPFAVRSFVHADIEAVLAVQAESPEIAPWSAWDYERVARNEMAGWVATEGTGVVGFLIARRVISDVEILNFAVATALRRQGIGTMLLGECLGWAKSFSAEKALLEVRISNLAAIRFYERHNFEVVGRRPHYYNSPIEDALLLTAPIGIQASD